jgi:hypothetical protein
MAVEVPQKNWWALKRLRLRFRCPQNHVGGDKAFRFARPVAGVRFELTTFGL